MAASLRIAVVGLGRWGPAQVRSFGEAPGARLVAVADPDPVRLRARCPPDAAPVAGLDALLQRTDVDAVVLATPSATHAQLATRVLCSGRHVLVEKPLSLDVGEAERLVRCAAGRSEVAVMAHLLEHHAAIAALASRVEDGAIGDVIRVEARRHATRVTRDDPWWTLAPHDLGLCLRFAGAPTQLRLGRTGARARAQLDFSRGVQGEIDVAFGAPQRVRELRLVGTRGTALLDDAPDGACLRIDSPAGGAVTLSFAAAELPLVRQARAFVAACRGEPVPPRCSLQDGLAIVRCLAAADQAVRPDGPVLQLPTSGSW